MNFALDISVLRIAQAGVQVYTRNLVEHLVTEGQAHSWTLLDVLPLNPGKPMLVTLRALDAPNVRVVRVAGLRRRYLSMHPAARDGAPHAFAERVDQALDHPWALAASAVVGLQLRAALRDVALFHSSDQFFYAPSGAAALLTIHDLTTRLHPELHVQGTTAMHSAKERFAAERASHLIADSEATRRDTIEQLGVAPERVSVVQLAVDERFRPYPPDEIQATLERYGLEAGGYIFSVGTLEPRKNYVRLIEAYAQLEAGGWRLEAGTASRSSSLKPQASSPYLVIAGGNGWKYDETLAAPKRFGVAGKVRFLGKVPDTDLPLLLGGAALFVYPSIYEGFGLPVLEALACGAPVVASHASSLPEVLGDAGLYCDPYDAASIAASIAGVLASPDLARRLRQAGPARAAQFSWRRTARETLDVYERVAALRGHR
jgi:glycosyltransferase involved in cell wall biosynthesis